MVVTRGEEVVQVDVSPRDTVTGDGNVGGGVLQSVMEGMNMRNIESN